MVGQVLGDRYVLESEIGHGGMATVYSALDRRVDRRVAVKVLSPDLTPLLGPDRFAREIQIAGALQHPRIVPLFDSGGDEGVLYFVMPLVDGETLRDRLRRETQLPLADVVCIARDVLEALGHAHAHAIVHRDIKPENILLGGGHAVVADFGVARAIDQAGGEKITSSGLAVGTPMYMSPEQAGAAGPVDGRSDLYSLACVLYEMVAGEPPFTGPTPQAILARQMQEAPRSLRVVRPNVPGALERVIDKGLAKVPADRFQDAAEFADALETSLTLPDVPVVIGRRERVVRAGLVGGVAVAIAVAVWAIVGPGPLGGGTEDRGDTTVVAVLPVAPPEGEVLTWDPGQQLHDALGRWTGITVLDAAPVADAVRRAGSPVAGERTARRVAGSLGAGRYIRAEVSRVGDSLRVHAAIFEAAGGGTQLADTTVRVGRAVRGADQAFAALADHLLLRRPRSSLLEEGRDATHSLPAHQAFHGGIAAIERWDLEAADSAFAAAAGRDPAFAQATLWLALTRWWQGLPAAAWRAPAERAASHLPLLADRDNVLANALVAIAAGRFPQACGALTAQTRRAPTDFTVWYTLATCLRRDSLVVRDARSPSGWSFRSSYHAAIRAYQQAFALLPSIHRNFRRDPAMAQVFFTNERQLRDGRSAPPEERRFNAHPSWAGDTLAFVPYPRQDFERGQPWTVPATRALAVRKERELFRDVATAWSVAFPESPDAMEALSLSLELLGDPACLDTLRRARSLVADPAEATRLAAQDVWLQLKFALPSSPEGVLAARALADSILRRNRPGSAPHPLLLSGLAALTGRATAAAAYARQPEAAGQLGVPRLLAPHAAPLLVYAALGGPADSLLDQELASLRVLDADHDGSLREDARRGWLVQAATLAFPRLALRSLAGLADAGDYLADAEVAFTRGDTAGVRATLAGVRAARQRGRPSDLAPDALYPEAWLLDAIGDPGAAAAWLDPTLAALAYAPPKSFADPVRAAALVHAMALRADAGARAGDTAAARPWARAVTRLWSDADPFLRPVVERSQAIAR